MNRFLCVCFVSFVKSFSSESNTKGGILIGGSSLLSASIMDALQQNEQSSTDLRPEMDIFSAGYKTNRIIIPIGIMNNVTICFFSISCALLELWSEGTAPFEFSQLLAYRSGDQELVTKHLGQLENNNLRNLIASMISRTPEDRKSAEVYLDEERGRYAKYNFSLF